MTEIRPSPAEAASRVGVLAARLAAVMPALDAASVFLAPGVALLVRALGREVAATYLAELADGVAAGEVTPPTRN
jgi:hypothetical protein